MASNENIYNSIQNLYNMDKSTWQEVLANLYNLVYDVKSQFEQVETRLTLLLGEEITEKIKEMYEDGTLAELIKGKLNEMNKDGTLGGIITEKINEMNKDGVFGGIITEKLNEMSNNGSLGEIINRLILPPTITEGSCLIPSNYKIVYNRLIKNDETGFVILELQIRYLGKINSNNVTRIATIPNGFNPKYAKQILCNVSSNQWNLLGTEYCYLETDGIDVLFKNSLENPFIVVNCIYRCK